MKNLILIALVATGLTAIAHPGGGHGPCAKAGMDKAKRQTLRGERKKFRTNTAKTLREEVRKARKAFRTAALDSKSTSADIDAAAEKLGEARGNIVAARRAFVAKMAHKLFPKKLKAGFRCLNKINKRKRQRRMRRGHR